MKHYVIAILCVMLLPVLVWAQATEPAPVIFCKSADFENWQPIDPGTVFDTNVISIMFETEKAFGVDTLVLTEYKLAGEVESITFRTEVAVSPDWGGFLVTDYAFVEPGAYIISFARPSGEVLAEGFVEILVDQEQIIEVENPEELQTEGKTLGDFFNQYRPEQ
ncbi:MAG: hypothetical protein D6E12_00990 [Desulfovibrio sp.]|nr:MAG: hypothetical protein D6E12_00990 [Desulfovibrio sp.]